LADDTPQQLIANINIHFQDWLRSNLLGKKNAPLIAVHNHMERRLKEEGGRKREL
jgi:hypothetical protein